MLNSQNLTHPQNLPQSQKVLQVVRRFSFNEWGGTEAVVWNTAQGLLAKGNNTEILSTSALDKPGVEERSGCQIKRYPYFYPHLGLNKHNKDSLDKKGGNPYSAGLYQALLSEPCRIIHTHSMQRMAAMTRMASQFKKIPYIVSLHGGHFLVPKSEIVGMTLPLRRTFNYGKAIDLVSKPNQILQDASGIICVGYDEFLAIKKRFPVKPVTYLPNGVNVKNFTPKVSKPSLEHLGIPSQSKIILCVSRIDPQKNQLALITLLKDLVRFKKDQPYHLLLIGPITNQNYKIQLEQYAIECGVKQHLTIIPGLKPDSSLLTDAYACATVFVLPSIHEPFGIVVLEAWASGLPVIASNVGGLAKLIDNNRTGLLFNPHKSTSLYETFSALEKNPMLAETIARCGKSEAERNYTWDRYVDRLLHFYDDVESWHRSNYHLELAV